MDASCYYWVMNLWVKYVSKWTYGWFQMTEYQQAKINSKRGVFGFKASDIYYYGLTLWFYFVMIIVQRININNYLPPHSQRYVLFFLALKLKEFFLLWITCTALWCLQRQFLIILIKYYLCTIQSSGARTKII